MAAIDKTYDPRPWKCGECGAILGYVLRDSSKARRLWTLRMQISTVQAWIEPGKDRIFQTAMTTMHERYGLWSMRGIDAAQGIGCDFCGCINAWHPSEEVLIEFLRRLVGDAGVREYKKLRN